MSTGSAKVLQPYVPELRAEAVRAFGERNPGLGFAPVVVVIAAYDEREGLGAVLEGVPAEACGMAVDTLVIDDGSRDGTSEVASAHGVHVARLDRNCGHGIALRLGYQLARERGARYVVTLDGDGQWDPAEVPRMLEPLVAGEADLVLGSRVLGRSEDDHAFRRMGVRVFAALVRLLTGVRVTDTSTGLRAMRVEVTATVRQEQVQYQTSELLIGAICQGYRVAERPIVQRRRTAGESKKGNDLLYGFRYARVVLGTWWRERGEPREPGVGRGRPGRWAPALSVVGFTAAVAIVVIIGVRAAQDVHVDQLTWWPLPFALAAAVGWWLLLARGWAILVTGRGTVQDVSVWCRTQTLRYLPGGVWAPASRATVVRGGLVDRLSTVAAENVIALCAALAVGGLALAAGGAPLWLPLVLALAVPALASRLVADRTRLAPARTRRALVNYLVAFVAYALAAVLVQAAVSGLHHPFAVAGAAAVAWAAGLVVVFAPGGLGVRELAYVGLLSHSLAAGELAAGAVTLRLLTVAAELGVLVVAGRPRHGAVRVRQALASGAGFAHRHAFFLALLAAGTALRVVTWLAYRPALINWDSVGYLANAANLRPDDIRPIGYPEFLRILPGDHLAVVPAAQHLMGMATAVLIYALLLRLGVRRWAAALATAPVLLDAYQLNIEQYILSESLFDLLLVAGCAALLWRRRPGIAEAATAGLLFAAATLTRANGAIVVVPAVVALICLRHSASARDVPRGAQTGAGLARSGVARARALRPGLSAVAALLCAFAVPLAAYAVWFHAHHGAYAITNYSGQFLYARVAPFADCSKFSVPADERSLCPAGPVGKRPTLYGSAVEYYLWDQHSPVWEIHRDSRSRVASAFARRVIAHQPAAYARAVTHDFLRAFALTRSTQNGELPASRWQFQLGYPLDTPEAPDVISKHGDGRGRIDRNLTRPLRDYQRFGFTPGPLLALALIAGLLAALGAGRARRSGLRAASFLFAATGFVLFASTVMVNQFSWRYMLPLLVLLPPAAALGLTALLRRTEPRPAPAADGVGQNLSAAEPARS